MKKRISACLLALMMLGCQAQQGETDTGLVSLEKAQSLSQTQEVVVLDVRTPQEYEAGHLKGAQLMDFYQNDFEAQVDKLDKNKKYLVYCKRGGRSAKAAEMLKAKGINVVYDMDGGFDAWADKELPVEK